MVQFTIEEGKPNCFAELRDWFGAYLDNDAIMDLAKGPGVRRKRFVDALHGPCIEEIPASRPSRLVKRLSELPSSAAAPLVKRKSYTTRDTPVEFGLKACRGALYAASVRTVRAKNDQRVEMNGASAKVGWLRSALP